MKRIVTTLVIFSVGAVLLAVMKGNRVAVAGEGDSLTVTAIERGSGGPIGEAFDWAPARPRLLLIAAPAEAAALVQARLKGRAAGEKDPTEFTVKALDGAKLYVLYGWSGSGSDDVRSYRVTRAVKEGEEIVVDLLLPVERAELMGTADMAFIGFEVGLEDLPAGRYTIRLFHTKPVLQMGEVVEEGEREAEQVLTLIVE